MSGTTSIGTPFPTLGDSSNLPADVQAMVAAVDKNSVPRFASTGARDAALAGTSFLLCWVGTSLQMWNGSVWVNVPPTHWIARGPSSTTDYTSTSTVVASVTVPQISGRRYRVEGQVMAQQITASGAPTVYVATGTSIASRIAMVLDGNATYAAGNIAGGTGAAIVTASTTGNVTYNLLIAQTAGALRVGLNLATICATDIGAA